MKKLTRVMVYAVGIGLAFVPGIYGLWIGFHASILLGIGMLMLIPSATFIGWVAFLGHPEVCKTIAAWLHLPV